MIHQTLLACGPTNSRVRVSIPHDDTEAILIWNIYISIIAESSITVGEHGVFALSQAEVEPGILPSTDFEWHNVRLPATVGGATRTRAWRFFMTGSVNGQNNPSLFRWEFKRGILLAGDFFIYTRQIAAGNSIEGSIIFEFETRKVAPLVRQRLRKQIGDELWV